MARRPPQQLPALLRILSISLEPPYTRLPFWRLPLHTDPLSLLPSQLSTLSILPLRGGRPSRTKRIASTRTSLAGLPATPLRPHQPAMQLSIPISSAVGKTSSVPCSAATSAQRPVSWRITFVKSTAARNYGTCPRVGCARTIARRSYCRPSSSYSADILWWPSVTLFKSRLSLSCTPCPRPNTSILAIITNSLRSCRGPALSWRTNCLSDVLCRHQVARSANLIHPSVSVCGISLFPSSRPYAQKSFLVG